MTRNKTRTHRCSTCGKTFDYESVEAHPTFPFCSVRCRNVDLGHWFTERYVISSPLRWLPDLPEGFEEFEGEEMR
jgi:hypothetical protein